MTTLNLTPFVRDGFSIEASLKTDSIELKVAGNGEMTVTAALGVFLKQLHEEARRLSIQRVTVHFGELYFMCSSCLKCFITWINCIKKLDPANRYGVFFLSNTNLHWQKRSLEAIRCFAPDVIDIES